MHRFTASLKPLATNEGGMRVSVYSLFIFSTFSITGIGIAVTFCYGAVLYHLLRKRPTERLPRWVSLPFLLYLGVTVLSALVNPDVLQNLASLQLEYRIFLALALVPCLCVVDLRRLLQVYAICVVIMALYGMIQYTWGVDWFRPWSKSLTESIRYHSRDIYRAKGNFSVSLTYAGVMLVNVVLFFSLFLSERGKARYGWGLTAVMAALATLFSFSRSGWLGMTFGTAVLLLRLPRRWAWPSLGLFLAVNALTFYLIANNSVQTILKSPSRLPIFERIAYTTLSSERARLYYWEAGLNGIVDNPVLGVGTGNEEKLRPYRDQVAKRHPGFRFKSGTNIHNVFLQVLFNLGAMGLAAFLSIYGMVFFWSAKWIARAGGQMTLETGILWGVSGGLFGSLVAGFFENNFLDGEVQTTLLMFTGLALYAGLLIRRKLGEPLSGKQTSGPTGP